MKMCTGDEFLVFVCMQMLLSEDEVKIKTQLWFAENADFLKEQEGGERG